MNETPYRYRIHPAIGFARVGNSHDVHFITYANPIRLDPDTPRIFYHEVEVSTYPLFEYPPYALALASRMMEVAQYQKLDLLHVHYAIPHSISALLAQQKGKDFSPALIQRRRGAEIFPQAFVDRLSFP